MKLFSLLILIVQTIFHGIPAIASDGEQQLLLLLEYVAVDYRAAIQGGVIVNKVEYAEMLEFSGQVVSMAAKLDDTDAKPMLLNKAETLKVAVEEKRSASEIKNLANQLVSLLIESYAVLSLPSSTPDISLGQLLYQEKCASCHGKEGSGDGPLSRSLDPKPTNFRDQNRYKERTLSGLYNTISLGVNGTSMSSFSELPEKDRWALAFYVGTFAAPVTSRPVSVHIDSVESLITMTPAVAESNWGESGANEMSWLRNNPSELFKETARPLDFSHQKLGEALVLYQSGDTEGAYQLSLVAYLEGFELIEPALKAVNSSLASEIESAMSGLRSDLQAGVEPTKIESAVINLQSMLVDADEVLRTKQLSPVTAFTSALVILLREGIEAMLVVLALVTFLRRTDRKEGVYYIHLGWVVALLAGVVTWWISISVVNISGASREVTEGIAALVASAILLYVGFWMHNKANAVNWQQYIEKEALKALSSGTLWGLSGLAFIAVYREVFETILFYQALWTQTSGNGKQAVVYGFVAGVLLLLVTGLLIARFSARLPIRQFFILSAMLMFGLAFILAGKGVAALQEAGWIDSSALNFVSIDVLGVHPTMESLAVQLLILFVGAGYWMLKVRNE